MSAENRTELATTPKNSPDELGPSNPALDAATHNYKTFQTGSIMNLKKIVGDIKKEHQQVEQSVRTSLEHARRAGELLVEVKEDVEKATDIRWDRWVEKECDFTERTASNYIRIFKEWSKIEKVDTSNLTVRGALSLLKTRTRKPKPSTPLTLDRLGDLMERFEIKGDPEKLVELIKAAGLKVVLAPTEEPVAAE
jgi:hypothetical protein